MTSGTVRPPAPPRPQDLQVRVPPDGLGYRLKCLVLGPPLETEQLELERLGKPTALAVFASDNLSSAAYATEEILRVLVPAVGLAAFSLVVPITIAMLVVLAFLILSYRQTIKEYPTAGGAYVVTRDNFGLVPAQVAGVALLTDYVLTVAVSVAAGTAALVSAFDGLEPFSIPIAVTFIAFIAYGNLRGVRESGRLFAAPTYFFVANMAILLGTAFIRMLGHNLPTAAHDQAGLQPLGSPAGGIVLGASAFVVLHAFASGGAAVTGVEAISNGVPAFRKPAWRNARTTLVIMGSLLGAMFLGLSIVAARLRVVPFVEGTPTVIAQVGELVYGRGVLGHVLFLALQASTMLILVLAANTSFADFPRLASFHAADHFMPRQLTKRGHRLVFSNGIAFLAAVSIGLVIVTGAQVDRLIPLYALGVFTSFTLSQAGMARHHLRRRESGWRRGLVVNGVGAVLSAVVDVVIAVTKFTHGAWLVVVLVPLMVLFLVRLARQYQQEASQLERDVPQAATARILRRHVALVLVDRLDLATARAIQYARTLVPDELRAVHVVVDHDHARQLAAEWTRLGLAGIPLELVDCPDRRLTRCAVETVAVELAEGGTEVSVLLPERKYRGLWRYLLHDRTGEAIEREVSKLPHANVTTVPFHFAQRGERVGVESGTPAHVLPTRTAALADPSADIEAAPGVVPIGQTRARQKVSVEGRVRSVRVRPMGDAPALECMLADPTGALRVVFLGRRSIAGIDVGTRMRIDGRVVEIRGRLAVLDPVYELLADHAL